MSNDKATEPERITRLQGFRFGLHDFLAELDVEALKKVKDQVEANCLNECRIRSSKALYQSLVLGLAQRIHMAIAIRG